MDLDAFIDAMDACGVRAVCICAGAGLILEEASRADGVRRANAVLAEACARHPGRWFAYLLVHPTVVDEALRLIATHAGDPHVIGVGELLPTGHFRGHACDLPAMREIAMLAGDHGLPLNIHTGDAASLGQVEWLIRAAPRTTVILAHAAGAMVAQGLKLLMAHERIWMDLSAHGWKPGIRKPLLAYTDKRRFLFGSDVPIFHRRSAVEAFAGMRFAPEDYARIASLNAETLFPKLTSSRSHPWTTPSLARSIRTSTSSRRRGRPHTAHPRR